MPLVDMPLAELRLWPGRNPRPDDFDAFWAKGLAEQEATPLEAKWERKPSPARVEWWDVTFQGVGGARLHAKVTRPADSDEPAPALFEFHGYRWQAPSHADSMRWAALGFHVYSLDVRGQGGSSEDVGGASGPTDVGHITRGLASGPEHLLFRQVFLDTVQLVQLAKSDPRIDPKRLATIGGSQGGALSLACAGLCPEIRRCVAEYPYLCDYQRVWEMDLCMEAYADIRDYIRRTDPEHKRMDRLWHDLGYIDIQFLAPRIQGKVLAGCGLMDTTCPPSSQFAAYNKIRDLELKIYPDFAHETLRGFSEHAALFLSQV